MTVIPDLSQRHASSGTSAARDAESHEAVRNELQNILESSFFRKAQRGRQFLRYVVEYKLEGHAEPLKERAIGVNLYRRRRDYATGDDPVVRVQAGEVRRKLEQYYQHLRAQGIEPVVRIELPVGSYTPIFHPASSENRPAAADSAVVGAASENPVSSAAPQPVRRNWIVAALCVVLLCGVAVIANSTLRGKPQAPLARRFWEPVFSTPQPVLICLAKGVTYRPDEKLYELYSQAHPGRFRTEVERSNDPLPLGPRQPILWGDMDLYDDYGIAEGDVSTALRVSEYLGSIGKPLQLRMGSKYSFEDLRHFPAVVIGAFNNRWTMDLMSGLHFAFVEQPGRILTIREMTPGGREWHSSTGSANGIAMTDYGIVTRLLDSKTGQFNVTAAGLTGSGTQAAGELATRPEYLEQALRSAPPRWERGNVQIVLQTSVTDGVPGPPQVVAAYYWQNP